MERPRPIVVQIANGGGKRAVYDGREALQYMKELERKNAELKHANEELRLTWSKYK